VTNPSISLSVPAVDAALAVLRVVACGAATQADLPYDRSEEAMLAVNEAATLVLAAGGAQRITAEFDISPGEVTVGLSSDPVLGHWPPASWEGSLEQRVIGAVADRVDVTGSGGTLASFRVAV
jgi:hypothetical protein